MLASDYLIDLGPGAGKLGGELVNEGQPKHFLESDTITSQYLSDLKKIEIPSKLKKT